MIMKKKCHRWIMFGNKSYWEILDGSQRCQHRINKFIHQHHSCTPPLQWKVRMTTSRHHDQTTSMMGFLEIVDVHIYDIRDHALWIGGHQIVNIPLQNPETNTTASCSSCNEMSVQHKYVIITWHQQWWHSSKASIKMVNIMNCTHWYCTTFLISHHRNQTSTRPIHTIRAMEGTHDSRTLS